ncbi:hypothetical protein [Agriterribacter sp.]|uniref:hypothetical protein n=1 Tax=Agriterribacter sp. TaxID=2821509 RepID=UPI002CDCB34F|nr:hypothetical protein [Agriterribacter sp.]HRO45590.1 hypothetical protein [Agriterribacter sp.]HRQ17214.1 hypothetical protein [Agriterribacter sp.]
MDNIYFLKQVKLIDFTIIPNFGAVNFNYIFRHTRQYLFACPDYTGRYSKQPHMQQIKPVLYNNTRREKGNAIGRMESFSRLAANKKALPAAAGRALIV